MQVYRTTNPCHESFGHFRFDILFAQISESSCGHQSLTRIVRFAPILVSAVDPSSAVFISRKGNKNMLPPRTQARN